MNKDKKTSVIIFCIYGLALQADKILQALELSILTWTDYFRDISPKLSRTYITANDSLWVELICFSQTVNFAEQTSSFKRLKIKPPYPWPLASVNTRQVVNAPGLNVYPYKCKCYLAQILILVLVSLLVILGSDQETLFSIRDTFSS